MRASGRLLVGTPSTLVGWLVEGVIPMRIGAPPERGQVPAWRTERSNRCPVPRMHERLRRSILHIVRACCHLDARAADAVIPSALVCHLAPHTE